MANIEYHIIGSEKLTHAFGRWPSFHDAEILDLHLWRGLVDPDRNLWQFPVLTLKVHVWELTKETNAEGYIILKNHTLSTLAFRDVSKLRIEGFNHLNSILELVIQRQERTEPPSPYFSVEMIRAHGIAASFECSEIEVTNTIPCTDRGGEIG